MKRCDPEEYLARRVSAKIEEGDFRGAIRLASSDDTLADVSDETYNALCAKHPPPHLDSHIPPNPSECVADEWEVSCAEVDLFLRGFSGCSEEVWWCEANSCGMHSASPRG